jgi:soluble lytic murein transglycosylase-like protein
MAVALILWTGIVQAELYFQEAGRRYGLSPRLLEAISWVESNHHLGAVNHNRNGSVDVCHMQINSSWRKQLGASWDHLNDPYYCTVVGAWILAGCVRRYGYTWDAVACYHTGGALYNAKNKAQHQRGRQYITKVRRALEKGVK